MSLILLSDLKTAIGETTVAYDDFLNGQIALFSSAISNYCSRVFESTSYTQTFYFSDYMGDENRSNLWLYHYPSTVITQVRDIVNFNGVDTTEIIPAIDFRIKENSGRVGKISSGLPVAWFNSSSTQRIEVDYTAGYTIIPLEIQDVMTSLIEERYNKKKAGVQISFGSDVQRISIPGTMSIDFDYSLQANERKARFGMLLGNYLNVLDFFRSERSLVGEIKENYVV